MLVFFYYTMFTRLSVYLSVIYNKYNEICESFL